MAPSLPTPNVADILCGLGLSLFQITLATLLKYVHEILLLTPSSAHLAPPESHTRLAPRYELSSPVTSDEEYLSPLEEFPDSGTPRHYPVMRVQPRSEIGPAPAHAGINFKAAPTFEVRGQCG